MKIPTLEKDRITLRPIKASDAKIITELLGDYLVTRYMSSIPYPYGPKDARSWISKTLKDYRKKQPTRIPFAIEHNGEFVGIIGSHRIAYGHMAEIGYWLGRRYWGLGIMPKALKIMHAYLFNDLRLLRLEAKVFVGNKGSERVLLKNGFKLEGRHKKAAKKNGKFYDVHIFGKIK